MLGILARGAFDWWQKQDVNVRRDTLKEYAAHIIRAHPDGINKVDQALPPTVQQRFAT